MPLPVTAKSLGIQNFFSKARGGNILASELKSHCEMSVWDRFYFVWNLSPCSGVEEFLTFPWVW